MSFPPWLARVRFRSITLWIPLILLWPLCLLVLVPFFLVGAATSVVIEGLTFAEFRRFCGGLCRLVCELRGTSITVEDPHVCIAFTLY